MNNLSEIVDEIENYHNDNFDIEDFYPQLTTHMRFDTDVSKVTVKTSSNDIIDIKCDIDRDIDRIDDAVNRMQEDIEELEERKSNLKKLKNLLYRFEETASITQVNIEISEVVNSEEEAIALAIKAYRGEM